MFNINDIVITSELKIGRIESICSCNSCKVRGFYEPLVVYEDSSYGCITDSDYTSGFDRFFRIGKFHFANLNVIAICNWFNDACKVHDLKYVQLYKQYSRLTTIANHSFTLLINPILRE